MTSKEQERRFELAREHFKNWNAEQISGYVHGAADGYKRDEPRQIYIERFKEIKDHYALGYIFGFVDAYGEDALTAEWSRELGLGNSVLDYRWWEK